MFKIYQIALLFLFGIQISTASNDEYSQQTTELWYTNTPSTSKSFNFRPTTLRTIETTIPNIKNQIKNVLKIQTGNETLDDLILNLFNIESPDPLYVFVLPGKRNKTLILRKSNFETAVFPNITSPKKIRRNSVNIGHLVDSAYAASTKRIQRNRQFRTKLDNFEFSPDDGPNDEKTRYVVEENVRTERNFFKYMDELNRAEPIDRSEKEADYYEYVKPTEKYNTHPYEFEPIIGLPIDAQQLQFDYPKYYESASNKRKNVNWKDLGLSGWSGGLSKHGKNFEFKKDPETTESYTHVVQDTVHIQRPPTSSYITSVQGISNTYPANYQYESHQSSHYHEPLQPTNYYHLESPSPSDNYHLEAPQITNYHSGSEHYLPPSSIAEHVAVQSYTPKPEEVEIQWVYPETTTNREETWEVAIKIPKELTKLLSEENAQLRESLEFNSRPIWPVTSSRAAHKDDDVYIGRANNPFGHSTKWKMSFSNGTITDDNNLDKDTRPKRGVLDLYSMVKCATGCDPLVFKGYGCYCGFLGSGKTLDGIDKCCKMHDYCYETANCPMFLEYFVPYLWKCYKGRPLCAIDHGEWGGPGSCASRLCECDQALSKCLRRYYCPRKRAVCTSSPLRLLQNVIMEF